MFRHSLNTGQISHAQIKWYSIHFVSSIRTLALKTQINLTNRLNQEIQ